MVRDIEGPIQRAKDTCAAEFSKYREALNVCVEMFDEWAPAGGGGRGAAGPVEPAAAVETPLAAPPPPRGGRW